MDQRQVLEAARQIGVAPGDHITLQTDGMIDHPHLHSGEASGAPHVDAWYVPNVGATLRATKIHSDD